MLKITVEDYYSFNDLYRNKRDFYAKMSRYQFFDLARMHWRDNLDHSFWDNLNDLRIVVGDNKSILIHVEEFDFVQNDEITNIINKTC